MPRPVARLSSYGFPMSIDRDGSAASQRVWAIRMVGTLVTNDGKWKGGRVAGGVWMDDSQGGDTGCWKWKRTYTRRNAALRRDIAASVVRVATGLYVALSGMSYWPVGALPCQACLSVAAAGPSHASPSALTLRPQTPDQSTTMNPPALGNNSL